MQGSLSPDEQEKHLQAKVNGINFELFSRIKDALNTAYGLLCLGDKTKRRYK